MAVVDNKSVIILNLTGPLGPGISHYFSQREIPVIDSMDESEHFTHILTKDCEDFSAMGASYETNQRDIKIISLSMVKDLKNFTQANGKLIFEEGWLQRGVGELILDKFFQEYGGMGLRDNYPAFIEKGSFNIVNPFNAGEYGDLMVHHAFKENVDALSIKIFFDHLLMYLAGLKTNGKIGYPIEVGYGSYGDCFGIQIQFYSNNLSLADVTGSLSEASSRKPEEYLLNLAIHTADFFDFSSIQSLNKTVITGIWTNQTRLRLESRGMMFSYIKKSHALDRFAANDVSNALRIDETIQDYSEKVKLPEEEIRFSGSGFNETLSEKISSSIEIEKVKQIVTGEFENDFLSQIMGETLEQENEAEVVPGSTEDDFKIKVSSSEMMEDIINVVKGKVEEESEVFRVSGSGRFDLDNFAFRVASGLGEKVQGNDHLKSTILNNKLPEHIKASFFEFLLDQNKNLETLTQDDLMRFKNTEIPRIIKNHTSISQNSKDDKLKTKGFISELKNELQAALTKEFNNESVAEVVEAIKTEEDILKVKETFKVILKKMLEEKFHLEEKDHISAAEQSDLVRSLSSSLVETEEKIRAIVTGEKQKNAIEDVAPLFRQEEVLRAKLDYQEKERQRKEDKDLKKLALDENHKEVLLLQKVDKLERQVKAKNFIINDTKESLSKLVGKKNQEILSLQAQMKELKETLGAGQAMSSTSTIVDLERQNTNHLKMIEVYKNKITQLSLAIQEKKSDPTSREEVLKLQKVINQYKNQTDVANKEFARFNDKIAADAALINNLKQEKTKLDQLFKKIALEVPPSAEAAIPDPAMSQEIKRLEAHNQSIKKQFIEAQTKVTELMAKLDEATRGVKKELGSEDGSKVKVNQLETTVKKLTQDLAKNAIMVSDMKKETNKLQKDKVALQNQLDKIAKETEKNKRTGGKAA